eukprot:4474353-Pleurochrysis_carterae.AAC.1
MRLGRAGAAQGDGASCADALLRRSQSAWRSASTSKASETFAFKRAEDSKNFIPNSLASASPATNVEAVLDRRDGDEADARGASGERVRGQEGKREERGEKGGRRGRTWHFLLSRRFSRDSTH